MQYFVLIVFFFVVVVCCFQSQFEFSPLFSCFCFVVAFSYIILSANSDIELKWLYLFYVLPYYICISCGRVLCLKQNFMLSISCSDWPRDSFQILPFFHIWFLFSPICELTSPRAPNSETGSVIGRWTSVLFSDWLAPQAHTLSMCAPCEAQRLFFCLPEPVAHFQRYYGSVLL